MRPQQVAMAGAPADGVTEVQTYVFDTDPPTGGTFTITFDGQTTAAIDFDATAAEVQAALEALSNIGSGGVVCTGGPLPDTLVTITFAGEMAGLAVAEITATLTGLTGGTPVAVIATTVAGVTGSFRGLGEGTILTDSTNGNIYVNSGTRALPVWSLLAVTI